MPWIALSITTVIPKVTSSELKGVISKRASTHCSAAPATKNSGGTISSAANASRCQDAAIW